jgi:uncharacterized membrane protein
MIIQEKNIRRLFLVSFVLKGVNAILEILSSILLLFTGTFSNLLAVLIKGELIEDPTDFVANHLAKMIPYLSVHTQLFAAFYLLSHGCMSMRRFYYL